MSGFEILAWNVEISGKTLPCSEPKLTKVLNGGTCDGEYQVQIENSLENRKLVRLREEIKFLYEGEEKFRGIIGPSKFEDTIEIRGKSVDKKLDWTIFSKDQGQDDIRRVQYDNIAANVILGDILSGTGFSVGDCPSTVISMRFEYGRRRKCAKFLAERLGKDFWVSPGKKVYVGDKGVTREKLESFVARSHIEDPDRITNKLYCLGYGDGVNQLSVVVEDTESQGEYGLSEDAFVDRRFIHQDSLEAYGNFKVAELKDPINHVPIEVPFTTLLDEGLEVACSMLGQQ